MSEKEGMQAHNREENWKEWRQWAEQGRSRMPDVGTHSTPRKASLLFMQEQPKTPNSYFSGQPARLRGFGHLRLHKFSQCSLPHPYSFYERFLK